MLPSLEAINLSKNYGSFTALSDLDLKIEGAKCVGFLGPNGAGKTTTLKIFTDLIRPSQGSALINGVSVQKDKRRALIHCGTIIENPEIYSSLTPREALMMIARMRGIPKEERKRIVEEAIAEVKMEDWIDKKVGKFSKGMKQRVNIASALLSGPEIILLDEPTSGLDPRGMAEVRELIKSLKQKRRLIFMSSHLLAEVSDVCDEVAMIDHGKLLVYDTLRNITSRFSKNGKVTIEVGFSRPIADPAVADIQTVSGVIEIKRIDPRNVIVVLEPRADCREKLLSYLESKKLGVENFKQSSSALEETYLHLIKDTV